MSADPLIATSAENCTIEDPINPFIDLILGGQCEIFSPDVGGIASIPQKRKADLTEAAINDLFIPPGCKSVTFHSLITRKKNVLNQLFIKAMTKNRT